MANEKSCPISFGGIPLNFPTNLAGLKSIVGDPLSALGIDSIDLQLGRVLEMVDPEKITQEALNGLNSFAEQSAQLAEEAAKAAAEAASAHLKNEFDNFLATANSYIQKAEAVAQGIIEIGEDFEGFASASLCSAAGDFSSGFAAAFQIPAILSGDDNGVLENISSNVTKLAEKQVIKKLDGPVSKLQSGFAFEMFDT